MNDQNESEKITKAERKQQRRQAKQEAREQERKSQQRKRMGMWVGALVVVAIIVAAAISLSGRDGGEGENTSGLSLAAVEGDWVKGNAESQVELVEYSDFQCPACVQFQPIMRLVDEELGDKVKIVYRHFPLSSHPHAREAAVAAEAAGKQDKFWEMHDLLFERQAEWSSLQGVEEVFRGYAEELELDIDQYKEHAQSDETVDRVQTHYDSGVKSGVNSTPTFFLNGDKMEGYANLDDFKAIIAEAAHNAT